MLGILLIWIKILVLSIILIFNNVIIYKLMWISLTRRNIITKSSFICGFKFVSITYGYKYLGITYEHRLWLILTIYIIGNTYEPIYVDNTYGLISVGNTYRPISVCNTYKFMFIDNTNISISMFGGNFKILIIIILIILT